MRPDNSYDSWQRNSDVHLPAIQLQVLSAEGIDNIPNQIDVTNGPNRPDAMLDLEIEHLNLPGPIDLLQVQFSNRNRGRTQVSIEVIDQSLKEDVPNINLKANDNMKAENKQAVDKPTSYSFIFIQVSLNLAAACLTIAMPHIKSRTLAAIVGFLTVVFQRFTIHLTPLLWVLSIEPVKQIAINNLKSVKEAVYY